MALTKETITDKIEIVNEFKTIQCREATVVKEDGVELSRSFHRHQLRPSECIKNVDGSFTHTDTDISGEPQETQNVCNAVWTDEIRATWKAAQELENYPA